MLWFRFRLRQILFFSHKQIGKQDVAFLHRFTSVGIDNTRTSVRKNILQLIQHGGRCMRRIHSHRRLRAEKPSVTHQNFQYIFAFLQQICDIIALIIEDAVVRCKFRRKFSGIRAFPIHIQPVAAVRCGIQPCGLDLTGKSEATPEDHSRIFDAIGKELCLLSRNGALHPFRLPVRCL